MEKIKIAFLDRDGVINQKKFNNGYIGQQKYFKWVKGAKKAIKFLKKKILKLLSLQINQVSQEIILKLLMFIKFITLFKKSLKK